MARAGEGTEVTQSRESRNERLAELIEQHGIYALASGDVRDILAALRVAPSEKGSKCAFYKCQNGTMTDHPYCADHAIPQPATRSNDKRDEAAFIRKANAILNPDDPTLNEAAEASDLSSVLYLQAWPLNAKQHGLVQRASILLGHYAEFLRTVLPSHVGSNGCACRFDDGVLIEVCEEHKAWKADAPPYTPSSTRASGATPGAYRWIAEAADVLKALHRREPNFERVDELLSGVPMPPEDLGFDSPADRYARAWKALQETYSVHSASGERTFRYGLKFYCRMNEAGSLQECASQCAECAEHG